MRHISEERLNAWLDGALPPEESETIAAHLRECPVCGAAANELKRLCETLDSLPAAPECQHLARNTLSALRREREKRELPLGVWPWKISWKTLGYGAMAAGLVLGVVLGSQFNHTVESASQTNGQWITQTPDSRSGEPDPYVVMLLSDEGGGL